MVSFAFKNVVLFVLIILIVHVLLKNAILERVRASIRHGDTHQNRLKNEEAFYNDVKKRRYLPTSIEKEDVWHDNRVRKMERRKRAKELADIDDDYDEDTMESFKNVGLTTGGLRTATETFVVPNNSSKGQTNDEDDMLRYVEQGDDEGGGPTGSSMLTDLRKTPNLTASFSAHKLPRAANSPGSDNECDTKARWSSGPPVTTRMTSSGQGRSHKKSKSKTKKLKENAMNGGVLFPPGEDDEDEDDQMGGPGGGIKSANAFDTNFETINDGYEEDEDA